MAAIVLQRQGDGCQPIETPEDWRQRSLSFLMSPNGPQKVGPEKKSGFLSIFKGSAKQDVMHWHEAWTFSMPMSGRSSFPLRSAIPFVVRCTTNKPIDLSGASPLAFRLYRRVRMLTGKKQKPIAMQQEPVAEAALRYSVEARGVHRINGVVTLPPNCVPNFEIHNLALDYYVAVVRLRDGAVLHKEAVNLACPPPIEPRTAYGPYPSGQAWRDAREQHCRRQNRPRRVKTILRHLHLAWRNHSTTCRCLQLHDSGRASAASPVPAPRIITPTADGPRWRLPSDPTAAAPPNPQCTGLQRAR